MRYGVELVCWTVTVCASATMLGWMIHDAHVLLAHVVAACLLMSLCSLGGILWELHQRLAEEE